MPSSINGVGTHYYGSRNKKARTAVCQHCGHNAELTSYETRLWFVFFFIPVIPFGRKRISDQCAVCNRHFAIDLKQWETGRQAETASAIERFRKDQSEEAAVDVHGQLLGFQQYEDAAVFRASMLEQFPDSTPLMAGLAAHLEFIGLPGEAVELWERSFRLDPELPEARVGMACRRMHDNKPDEARELLSFLEQPGAEQQYSLDPLFDLAGHYQQGSDHEQTIQVFEVLLKAYPDLAKDHKVRAFVQTSEKALHRKESILPATQHSVSGLFTSQYSSNQRWAVGIAITLVLAVIGMTINNEYIRRHRLLTVINDTGVAATIQIDDQSPLSVMGMQTLTMSEGTHTLRVFGPVVEIHTLDVEADYWDRWTKNPVWILNVGGAGIIADVTVYYAVNPRAPTVRLIADPLIVKPDVDFAFEEPPESVSISGELDVQTRTAIAWLEVGETSDATVAGFDMLQQSDAAQAWSYAQRQLQRDPENENLLNVLALSAKPRDMSRLRTLLESKLDYRPVVLHWHRLYQNLPDVSKDYAKTLALYETYLRADPQNAKLIYLRGRFDRDLEVGQKALAQAIETDPAFGWPCFSRGYTHMCSGEWQSALDDFRLAIERNVPPEKVQIYRHVAMLGLRRLSELEQQYTDSLVADPASTGTAALLAETLVIQNRIEDAEQVVRETSSSFKELVGEQHMGAAHTTEAMLLYFKDEVDACKELAGKSQHLQPLKRMVSIEAGGAAEFAGRYELNDDVPDRWLPLTCSLAFHAAGDTANREVWYDRTVEQLRRWGPRIESTTRILSSEKINAGLIQELRLIHELPMEKAVILTSLGLRAESDHLRRQFFDAAKEMMVRRRPPYLLLKKIHEAAGRQQ
ncbi:MAG TPA: zinc-ribbon domain-containing protein [Planctomycetes bacterium]|nr:zinc-ribbon domain-containing protein [Fuerstiella sp.]HIK92561.1 zinc-ribbon domain-containing protein [Planctomycetota bacterium]